MKRPVRLMGIAFLVSIAIVAIDNAAPAKAGNLAGNWLSHVANHWQIRHQQISQGDRLSCNLVSVSPKRQITRLCAVESQLPQN